jgi:hypothetical protein
LSRAWLFISDHRMEGQQLGERMQPTLGLSPSVVIGHNLNTTGGALRIHEYLQEGQSQVRKHVVPKYNDIIATPSCLLSAPTQRFQSDSRCI